MIKTVLLFFSLVTVWFQTTGTLTGKWKLTQYTDFKTGKIDSIPAKCDDQKNMVFNFSDNQKEGTLGGQTISNSLTFQYSLSAKNKITTSLLLSAKVGDFEKFAQMFEGAIEKATTYKIDGNTLIIYYDNDTKCMLFIKQK
jgi:hypothetical protein